MIGTGNGIGLREVKLAEPETYGTKLATVAATGVQHTQNTAHLMVTKRGLDPGRKIETQTIKAGDLKK
jgi:hypothetical protein